MKELKILQKGYTIDFSRIAEGFVYDQSRYEINAVNKNQARSILLGLAEDMQLYTGVDLTYITIPVITCPQADLIEFEDRSIIRYKLNTLLKMREWSARLKTLEDDSSVEYCYIMKRGEYYLPDSCGYTSIIERAGVYPKAEALQHARGCNEISLKPVDIQQHNKRLTDEMASMYSRLIHTEDNHLLKLVCSTMGIPSI